MPRRPHDRGTTATAVLLLCCGAVLFGVMDGLAKLLAGEYSAVQLVWARYAFAVRVILLSARPAAWPGLLRCERPSLQAGRGLLAGLANGTPGGGVRLLPPAGAPPL